MRFFTRRWHGGDMPDDDSDAVVPAYEAHVAAITAQLPPALREFARTCSIHDALLRSCRVDDARGTLAPDLVVGNLGTGYFDLRLRYDGIALPSADRAALAQVARDAEAEALYDEVDVGPDGVVIHRWLWWPYAEVDIRFTNFAFEMLPRADRSVAREEPPFLEVPPTDR